MSKEKVNWKILKEPCGVISYCALGVSRGNDSLKNWLNVALYELHETGFINNTWKKWYGVNMTFSCQPQPFF
jgi:polar amino acid transport system substrate-binding protein